MIYAFLAEGFEEIEALCPLDIMRRAGIEVTTVGIGSTEITGAHGIRVTCDVCSCKYDPFSDCDMIFLPGGMPGTLNLKASDKVIKAVENASKNGRYIAAICAAPSILGELGLLQGKRAVCYPGFENKLIGAMVEDTKLVRDGTVITAKGMGVATELGLEIVGVLCSTEKADELRRAIIAD